MLRASRSGTQSRRQPHFWGQWNFGGSGGKEEIWDAAAYLTTRMLK